MAHWLDSAAYSFLAAAEILQQNLFVSASPLSQIAASVVLGEREYAEAQKSEYATNRLQLDAELRALGFDVGAAAADDPAYRRGRCAHCSA